RMRRGPFRPPFRLRLMLQQTRPTALDVARPARAIAGVGIVDAADSGEGLVARTLERCRTRSVRIDPAAERHVHIAHLTRAPRRPNAFAGLERIDAGHPRLDEISARAAADRAEVG